MAIAISCHCGQQMQVPGRAAGKTCACPACGRVALIPRAAGTDGAFSRSAGAWVLTILGGGVAVLSGFLLYFWLLQPPGPTTNSLPGQIVEGPTKPGEEISRGRITPLINQVKPTIALDRMEPLKPRLGREVILFFTGTTANQQPAKFRHRQSELEDWVEIPGAALTLTPQTSGELVLFVEALDDAGQVSSTLRLSIPVLPANRAPTLTIASIEPTPPRAGEDLTILLQGQDADGDPLDYQYRASADPEWVKLPGPKLVLKDLRPGALILEFRVVDALGASSPIEKRSWTIATPPPPKNLVGAPLKLEWKLKPGDTLYQEVVIVQQPTYRVAGVAVKSLINMQLISKLTVDQVDADGNMVITQKVEAANMGKIDDLSRGVVGPALAKLPGTTFTVRMNQRMEVVKFDGGNDQVQAQGGNLAGGGFVQLTSLIERDAWKEFAQLAFFQPNRALKAGEKWANPMTHSWGSLGVWNGQAHYAFAGQKKNLHQFDYALQLAFTPGKQPGNNQGLICAAKFQPPLAGGSILFDADTNKVLYAEERFRVRGAMTINLLGQNTTVEVEEDQLIGVRLTDQRPK